ncbi:hypothetical protein TI39_contig387g00005 [Zymoseptoria brevis]|uniref:Uncharacterized protein n=1 Tax=Zymoseptoria brevis TaxID=1047168 RepID=A0A0F4GRK0_9PEZI|nr:hypothetical protein TI39_contig387g00005 [Zymoseptoria brevis]
MSAAQLLNPKAWAKEQAKAKKDAAKKGAKDGMLDLVTSQSVICQVVLHSGFTHKSSSYAVRSSLRVAQALHQSPHCCTVSSTFYTSTFHFHLHFFFLITTTSTTDLC